MSAHRRRRRQQLYWRLAGYGLAVAVLGATAAYAYQVGAAKTAAMVGKLRDEIEDLRESNTALSERAAAAVQRADEARSQAQAIRERYDAEVPRGIERELFTLVERQLEAGVAPERLAFVIEQSGLGQRECEPAPETKRFLVRTPIGGGAANAVRFGDGRIVVTGAGAAARNAQGRVEAWFDPAEPVALTFRTIGGRAETKEGVLPLNHAMVVDGREYRFNAVDGERRGFIEVTAQSCAFP